MSFFPLTQEQQDWKDRAAAIADKELAPRAEQTDRERKYPRESLDALRDAGFWALRVDKQYGGQGADLLSTVLVVEELAKRCPSTAMCYKMHLEASEVINRMPTDYQVENFVKPMARGEVFTTVAGSETWRDGDNWTTSREFSVANKVPGGYKLNNVRKSYVTSSEHATHYFFLCRMSEEATADQTSLLFVERDKIEWELLEEWNGLGLRGNASSPMRFNGVVPEENRIGGENTGMAEAGGVFVPVLGLTYAAAYLGTGSGAFDLAKLEGDRRFASGSRRMDAPVNQRRMAELSVQIEAAQTMLHAAAATFDAGKLGSPLPIMQAKVLCSETAVNVTQELMTMFGGTAFAGRMPMERYFRDARAGMIMALPNDGTYDTISNLLFPAK
ncbi:MAG: acyl-CoA/acyl-ACP dehydrogenase [Chloroflexi bacterium]|nr:acyl-CoA/acyl-ACP dehydrogenase [Chloroflexota bacterium]MDA1226361.1 acyl-CoA/acyl-ACP dehydrogenase [Chloroflexota bacterium]